MRNPIFAYLGCLLVYSLQNVLFATAGQVYIEPPNGTKFAVGANKTIGYSNGPREYDDNPCCRPGDPDETWKKEGAPQVTFTGDADSTGKLDTTTEGDKTVTIKVKQKWTCPGGGEEYTEDSDTATYKVTNSFFVNITGPEDQAVKGPGSVLLKAKAENGNGPYTLTWTATLSDGTNITPTNATQSQADASSNPSPDITLSIPSNARGKKVTISVSADDSSNPAENDTDSVTLYIPKFTVKKLTFLSDHGVMKDATSLTSEGGQVYPEPEFDSERPEKNWPISHTRGMPVNIKFDVEVLPNDLPAKKFQVKIVGGYGGFNFDKSDISLQGGDNDNIAMTSTDMTDDSIKRLNSVPLDFKFILDGNELALGNAGQVPYVFLLESSPMAPSEAGSFPMGAATANSPSVIRLYLVTQIAMHYYPQGVQSEQEMVNAVTQVARPGPTGSVRGSEWLVPSAPVIPECIDHVVFWLNALAMVGYTSSTITYVYPELSQKDAYEASVASHGRSATVNRQIQYDGILQNINSTGFLEWLTDLPPAPQPNDPPQLVAFNLWEGCLKYGGEFYLGGEPNVKKGTPKQVFEYLSPITGVPCRNVPVTDAGAPVLRSFWMLDYDWDIPGLKNGPGDYLGL